ncbi:septum formation protein MAF homologue, putative [Trypanosoma brucei gambiense DAL972]|uniref:Septum formation protein MAF homologue, putative n=2 Tax=Trypanosoma brucei TaxID=5691 RepID=C9ZIP5_TRYB9|nr:septum formation protein MAF homologue, putative [Trypanosoma brucei gambiense DAL972]CBH09037.1 septum formation protein MAF homologue, putative [Trypanosoma brucei gambiense DAL972]|eukprot:XP_011771478.1 septum formation protein MAF homologue, putative [Trypanosoma brucei gambiense DAL972]
MHTKRQREGRGEYFYSLFSSSSRDQHQSSFFRPLMVLQHLELLRKKRILLASASPRRLEILKIIGLDVHVCPSGVAEDLPKSEFKCGGDYALCTAKLKAKHIIRQKMEAANSGSGETQSGSRSRLPFDVLIAADTVSTMPAHEGDGTIDIIEKPSTREEAAATMRRLSGNSHEMWTGVAIAVVCGKDSTDDDGGVGDNCEELIRWFELKVCTTVHFAVLSEAEILAYTSCPDNWAGKAAGYGIQGIAACMIRSIEGDYYNVMGLPLQAVCALFDKLIDEGIISHN